MALRDSPLEVSLGDLREARSESRVQFFGLRFPVSLFNFFKKRDFDIGLLGQCHLPIHLSEDWLPKSNGKCMRTQ
jgi:hypothetical protein